MDVEDFWTLVDVARREARDDDELPMRIAGRLEKVATRHVTDFHRHLNQVLRAALTWELWAAAGVVTRGACSCDEFLYFRAWLVGQGRDLFRAAVADADSLAAHPRILALAGRPVRHWTNAEWPHLEELLYAAARVYEHATGISPWEEDVAEFREWFQDDVPDGTGWEIDDPSQLAERLPRLTALFSPPVPRLGGSIPGHLAQEFLSSRATIEDPYAT